MEDTLRYFFSSIFQGIAALFALGSMYYISYREKIESKKKDINFRAENHWQPTQREDRKEILETSCIEWLINTNMDEQRKRGGVDPSAQKLADEYLNICAKENEIKKEIPKVVKKAVVILISSLIFLFLVGYSNTLNYILCFLGFCLIVYIILFFNNLMKVIRIHT